MNKKIILLFLALRKEMKRSISMKQLKRPTRKVKEALLGKHLSPYNWFVERRIGDRVVIIHRFTGTRRELSIE